MDRQKRLYIADELFSLVFQGTLGRSITYDKRASESQRAAFKAALRRKLEAVGERYRKLVEDEEHIAAIERLARELSTEFKDCLHRGRFRIGSAQKALNLHLKYLWCVETTRPCPPHCPFDSIIIDRLGLSESVRWTALDDISIYRQLVDRARSLAAAKGQTIAEWELCEYNEP